jgi:hypothetical protein
MRANKVRIAIIAKQLVQEINLVVDYDADITPALSKAIEQLEIAIAYMQAKNNIKTTTDHECK